MNKWLDNFAYRIDIGITPFIISFLIALLFTFVIVSGLGIKAAMTNPITALRYE
jgi:putative ABC transport system permease protein